MDAKIKKIIEATKVKFGLANYYLQTHMLSRSVDIFRHTKYTVSMEWFPNHITELEDEHSNPDGTVIIDMDVHQGTLESIVFVGEKTFAKVCAEDWVKWIEHETGLIYEEQFQLVEEKEGRLLFRECFNGVAVSPSGHIELNYNQEGYLTLFAAHGQFPSKEKFKEEAYTLSLEDLEDLAKEQITCLEIPSNEQEQMYTVYAVEELYVTNDQTATIPYAFFVNDDVTTTVDEVIYWHTSLDTPFERKRVTILEDVTAEQAFTCEPHPDIVPISEQEQKQCILAVTDLLRQKYPNDTGKWILKTLHRAKGTIKATLRASQPTNRVFQLKLLITIDAKSLQAINYLDNQFMLDSFDQYKASEKVTVTKEEAFAKLKNLFELKAVYVYDVNQEHYVLCGKLDCAYAINAASGEVIVLEDL